MKKTSYFTTALFAVIVFSSCEDKADDPGKNEENELITKVHLHLDKVLFTDTLKMAGHAEWFDNTPFDLPGREVMPLILDTNSVYLGEIELSDASKNPEVDITEEVAAEKEDHLFVYKANSDSLVIQRTDLDKNGREVGLKFRLTTKGLKGISRLNVILKHQPGIKDGSEGLGDTDLDIWFPVEIK